MSLLLLLLVMKSLRASNNVMDGQQIYFYYNTSVVYLFNMDESTYSPTRNTKQYIIGNSSVWVSEKKKIFSTAATMFLFVSPRQLSLVNLLYTFNYKSSTDNIF
jgi:hypothetical protein